MKIHNDVYIYTSKKKKLIFKRERKRGVPIGPKSQSKAKKDENSYKKR